MFGHEDTPLFSGTPMKATTSRFNPKPVSQQLSMASCRICLGTGKVIVDGRERICNCEAGDAIMQRHGLLSDCRMLSGSTMGSLTGLRKYDDIDRVQGEFVLWVAGSDQTFANWQEAWNAFADGRNFTSDE